MRRRKTPKPGQLLMYFGKLDGDLDMLYSRGDGVPKCDAHLLHHIFGSSRLALNYGNDKENSGLPYKFVQSFFDELKDRGYDITTLYFSVEKKP